MPTRRDLEERLAEQVGWLRTSASQFDAGDRSEAKRVASAVRTLVHSTPSSQSLLTQMGLLDSMTWFSAVEMFRADGTSRSEGLWVSDIHSSGYEPIRTPATYEYDSQTWWTGSIFSIEEETLSRRYFVLHAANIDGGSHVDPQIPDRYEHISRRGGLEPERINSAGDKYRDSSDPTPSVLRTIASEIIISIENAKWGKR